MTISRYHISGGGPARAGRGGGGGLPNNHDGAWCGGGRGVGVEEDYLTIVTFLGAVIFNS